jgi:hypothetical protein
MLHCGVNEGGACKYQRKYKRDEVPGRTPNHIGRAENFAAAVLYLMMHCTRSSGEAGEYQPGNKRETSTNKGRRNSGRFRSERKLADVCRLGACRGGERSF